MRLAVLTVKVRPVKLGYAPLETYTPPPLPPALLLVKVTVVSVGVTPLELKRPPPSPLVDSGGELLDFCHGFVGKVKTLTQI